MSQQKEQRFEANADDVFGMLESHGLEYKPEDWPYEDLVVEFKKVRKAIQLLVVAGILKPHKFHEAMELAELFE